MRPDETVFYSVAVLVVSRAELQGAGTRWHTPAQRVGGAAYWALGLAYAADVMHARRYVIPTRI